MPVPKRGGAIKFKPGRYSESPKNSEKIVSKILEKHPTPNFEAIGLNSKELELAKGLYVYFKEEANDGNCLLS